MSDQPPTLRTFDLLGRTALVTGGGRGLGRAIALRLGRAGARVAVNDLDRALADETVQILHDAGASAFACLGDIANIEAVESVFDLVGREGGLDVLVNNAGVAPAADIFETEPEEWDRVLRLNLGGAYLCSRKAMTMFRTQARGGRIIMIGSVVGHQGAVKGWVHYGASKAGLHGLAKTLARTGAAMGVTVNVVAPGVIATDMLQAAHGSQGAATLAEGVPLGYLGDPDDVAAAVHYLASDAARYVTGATLDVNGGLYMRA